MPLVPFGGLENLFRWDLQGRQGSGESHDLKTGAADLPPVLLGQLGNRFQGVEEGPFQVGFIQEVERVDAEKPGLHRPSLGGEPITPEQ